MTEIVETVVAQVVMNEVDARALTDRIRFGIAAVWSDVVIAHNEGAWSALKYQTWDEYCDNEFGASRIRIPREERQDVVCSLREAGLSTRAIAAATGDSRMTVHRELATVTNVTDDDAARIKGLDGRSRPARRRSSDAAQSSTPKPSSKPKNGNEYRGRKNQKQQINALAETVRELDSIAGVLSNLFSEQEYQYLCTPEVRETRIKEIRTAWGRISATLTLIKPSQEELSS